MIHKPLSETLPVLEAKFLLHTCLWFGSFYLVLCHIWLGKTDLYHIKRKKYRVSVLRFRLMFSIISSLFTVYSLLAWMDQFMGKQRIKFSPNDNLSLTSPEKTNGAPRWCFNITNYLGVLRKGTDVALRMRQGWGAGQGHHTPRLGSDKHAWLGVFTCPWAIKGRRGQRAQQLWIKCYSTEGLRGGWGQGHWGSALSYAWLI